MGENLYSLAFIIDSFQSKVESTSEGRNLFARRAGLAPSGTTTPAS